MFAALARPAARRPRHLAGRGSDGAQHAAGARRPWRRGAEPAADRAACREHSAARARCRHRRRSRTPRASSAGDDPRCGRSRQDAPGAGGGRGIRCPCRRGRRAREHPRRRGCRACHRAPRSVSTENPTGGRIADALARPTCGRGSSHSSGERPTLLVLDNCEQVIDAAARVGRRHARHRLGSLRVLATSRTPLMIAAEAVYPLAALRSDSDQPDAVGPAAQLFLDRARAVRPNATLPLDVVLRLCQRLDGLPLAIELAAARVRSMTPEQIEARLADRFALLTTGDRAAPERHRTLQAVIEWSWDLVDGEARDALATLSVLPAGFSAPTAAGSARHPVRGGSARPARLAVAAQRRGRRGQRRDFGSACSRLSASSVSRVWFRMPRSRPPGTRCCAGPTAMPPSGSGTCSSRLCTVSCTRSTTTCSRCCATRSTTIGPRMPSPSSPFSARPGSCGAPSPSSSSSRLTSCVSRPSRRTRICFRMRAR